MRKGKLLREFYFTLVSIIVVMLILTGSTFAWFTQTAFVNTEVYSASVDGGDPSLLISLTEDGTFDVECELVPTVSADYLYPVSTADLNVFYYGTAVKGDGITYKYKEADITKYLINGTVYLKSINGSNDVYFDEEKFNVSMIDGTNAGLRLGLIINGNAYIFNLDEGNGEEKNTIEAEADSVVESIDGEGNPNYINDIALDINDYKANGELAGNNSLITIAEDEVIPIEYFVYLEGCDKNCFNVVQNKDIEITLGFQGVSVNEAQ